MTRRASQVTARDTEPRTKLTRRFTGRATLLAASLLLAGSAAHAASGWLDKLKDTFDSKPEAAEGSAGALSVDEIGSGLKEALRVGTEKVVSQLGQPDGFNLDPEVHIPLPGQLDQVKEFLAKVGMEDSLTDLETRLNRAAELAAPRAKALFLDAISALTLKDVRDIYDGAEDAATQYFRSHMSEPLAEEMKPVVDSSLEDAGAVQVYDTIMERYRNIPFAPKVDADLGDYVVDKGTDGIFHYLAKEEAAIRADPARRTTDLLRRVFGR